MKRWRRALLIIALPMFFACSAENVRDDDAPSPARINVELGKAYMKDGNYTQASKKLEKALRQDPEYAPAHAAIAVLYQRLGEIDKADRHFKQAVELAPNDPLARNNYGAFLCGRDRFEEAEKQFVAATKNPLYDKPEYAFTNAGMCAMRSAEPEKAERYLRLALKRNSRFAIALYQMARLSFQQGKHLQARAYMQRFLETGHMTPGSLWLGIQIERSLGDKHAAARYAEQLTTRFPDSKQARRVRQAGNDDTRTGQ